MIHPDASLGVGLSAYWRHYSQEDQDDFGVPPEAYYTASGHWLYAEVPKVEATVSYTVGP